MAEDEDRGEPPAKGRFAALPPRVDPDDMVEEQGEAPVPEVTQDPNTEVAWRWGLGIDPGG